MKTTKHKRNQASALAWNIMSKILHLEILLLFNVFVNLMLTRCRDDTESNPGALRERDM